MFLHSGVSPGPCLNHLEGLALLTNSRDCVPLIFPGQEEKTPPQHVYYHSKVSEKIFTARSFYFFFFLSILGQQVKRTPPRLIQSVVHPRPGKKYNPGWLTLPFPESKITFQFCCLPFKVCPGSCFHFLYEVDSGV
jgi:hypothetical protein